MKQVNKILQTMEKVFKAEKEVSPDEKMNLEETSGSYYTINTEEKLPT